MQQQQRHLLVEQLFHAALALPPDERATFLDSSCGYNQDLVDEVRSLISADEEAQSFLSYPALPSDSTTPSDREPETMTGRRFGQYEILELIGKGGMGEVYRARDTRLARDVAIKFVPPTLARDENKLRRLEREARMLASLNHPNIATIYGLEFFGDARLIVMEMCEGEALDEVIGRGPMPVDQALAIFRQIAEALEAAHARGVIHRDLKPANIKLSPEGKVKVLDFGLAKSLGVEKAAQDTPARALSESGMVMGTPAYMSPEQARGEAVDNRTDIWSFGAVVYEALSGERAFGDASLAGMLNRILDRDPDWEKLPVDTPPAVRETIRRCLVKTADARAQQMTEVRSLMEGVITQPVGSITQASGEMARPRTATGLLNQRWLRVVIIFLALMIVAVASWRLTAKRESASGPTPKSIKSLAVLPLKPLGKDADDEILGMGIADAIITRVSQAGDLIVRPTSAIRKYTAEDTNALAAAHELQAESVLDGSLQRAGDRLRVSVNLLRASDGASLYTETFDLRFTDIFAIEDEVARQVTARLQRKLSATAQARLGKRNTTNAEAYEYFLRGNYGFDKRDFGGNPDLETAVAMYKRAVEIDPNYALAHARLAFCYAWKALFTDSENPQWIALAREELRQAEVLNPDLGEISEVRSMILWSHYEGFNTSAAIRELRRAQQIDPNFAHLTLAGILNHIGLDAAVDEAQRALELDPTSQNAKAQIVEAYEYIGKFDEAIVESTKWFHQQKPTEYLIGESGPAFALMRRNRVIEAAEIVKDKLAKEPTYIRAQAGNVLLLAMDGRLREAEKLIPAISEKFRNSLALHHATYDFACAYAVGGKAHEAVEWLRKTVEYGWPDYPLFNADPLLDPIRRDPEFIRFMQEFKPRWDELKREFDG